MKKPQTSTKNPSDTSTTEQTVAAKTETTKTPPKKTSKVQPAEKKAKSVPAKPKEEQPTTTVATDAAPKKANPKPAAQKKAETVNPELTISQRVGLTAGGIWHYLSENGDTSVSKLVATLAEEEKIIQRSIGWLAQEDKITLNIADRVEIISLKE